MIAGVLSVFSVFDSFHLHFSVICDTMKMIKKGELI